MMKIIKNIFSLALVLLLSVALLACEKKGSTEPVSRVQIDVNPSIELLVDENNVVVSASGLNDDGMMVVAGEEIEGKKVDEACSLIVNIMTETGFIVKGEASADKNEIKVSVTSNIDEVSTELFNNINSKISTFLSEHDIEGKITKAKELTKAQVEQLLLNVDRTITAVDAQAMTINELYKQLAVARLEQAGLYSQALLDVYNDVKAYEIKILEKEETAKIIDGFDASYQTVKEGYTQLIESLKNANKALDDAKYTYLIDPECSYQKAVAAVKEQKILIVQKQNEIATMQEGTLKAIAVTYLETLNLAYTTLVNAIDSTYNIAIAAINASVAVIDNVLVNLENFEAQLPANIKDALTAKAGEIEQKANALKDNFFETFEATHKEDIEKINAQVLAYKESLKGTK